MNVRVQVLCGRKSRARVYAYVEVPGAGGFNLGMVLFSAAPEVKTEIHTQQETQEKGEEKMPGMINEPKQDVPVSPEAVGQFEFSGP